MTEAARTAAARARGDRGTSPSAPGAADDVPGRTATPRAWGAGRVGLFAGSLSGLLYAATVVRGLGWDDAAELSAGIANLGVVHQTGYPLYLLAGKIFTLVLPFIPTLTATNLFSAATAAVCVGSVAAFTAWKCRSVLAGAVAAFVLSTGSIFWSQARVASVYPLYLCLIAALLICLAAWEHRPGPWRLAAVGACVGALLVSHRTAVVFAAAVLLRLVVLQRQQVRNSRPLLAALAACAPLLTLLYLPARADRTDFPDALEDSGGTILQWVTGTVPTPDAEVLSMSALEVLRNIAEVGVLGLSQLSVASLVLVPLGLWSLRGEGTLLWCGVAPAVVVSGISTTTYGNYGYWHLPLLLVGGILTGSGASRVAGALRGLRAPARTVAAVVGCAGLLTSAGAGIAYLRSEQLEAIAWARETLEKAPRGAVIEGGWTGYTVLRATQSLVGSRPDVRVVEGEYWVTAADLDAAGTPLLAAIAFQPMRSNCTLTVTPLGRATPTNVKGLTNVHFLGVQLGPDQTIAQLIRVAPGGGGASCSDENADPSRP